LQVIGLKNGFDFRASQFREFIFPKEGYFSQNEGEKRAIDDLGSK
jgi:hypothetical protein